MLFHFYPMLLFDVMIILEYRTVVEQNITSMFMSLDVNRNGKIEPNEIDESVEPSLKILNIKLNTTNEF